MVALDGVVEQRVYLARMTTQVTVSIGGGARLVAVEQQTYRASAEDRYGPGARKSDRLAPRALPGSALGDRRMRGAGDRRRPRRAGGNRRAAAGLTPGGRAGVLAGSEGQVRAPPARWRRGRG